MFHASLSLSLSLSLSPALFSPSCSQRTHAHIASTQSWIAHATRGKTSTHARSRGTIVSQADRLDTIRLDSHSRRINLTLSLSLSLCPVSPRETVLLLSRKCAKRICARHTRTGRGLGLFSQGCGRSRFFDIPLLIFSLFFFFFFRFFFF